MYHHPAANFAAADQKQATLQIDPRHGVLPGHDLADRIQALDTLEGRP